MDALGISASNAGPHLSTLGRDLSSIADTYRYIDPKRRDIVWQASELAFMLLTWPFVRIAHLEIT